MYAVIRIRGRTGIKQNIAAALEMLNLTRISHTVVIPETQRLHNLGRNF